jgi:hypothetical protein
MRAAHAAHDKAFAEARALVKGRGATDRALADCARKSALRSETATQVAALIGMLEDGLADVVMRENDAACAQHDAADGARREAARKLKRARAELRANMDAGAAPIDVVRCAGAVDAALATHLARCEELAQFGARDLPVHKRAQTLFSAIIGLCDNFAVKHLPPYAAYNKTDY